MATTVYVWKGQIRWFAYAPGKFGATGSNRETAIAGAKELGERSAGQKVDQNGRPYGHFVIVNSPPPNLRSGDA